MKGKKSGAHPRAYSVELRRRAVKLHVEEGFSLELIARELGADKNTIHHWVQRYRKYGEAGLTPQVPRPGGMKTHAAIRSKIVEVKTQHPHFGIKRVAQWLRRVLFLKTSPETVRKTLHQQGLMPKKKTKTPRNPPKPRFFERATPNQLWQSDIFTFRLGGQNAYLIGFIDDHSRYITGLGLFRSQTTEHVLEVYRTAVGEYGLPKEMLTDNGRQYASWHGKTRFQQELAKDRIHHLRSAPHHPMTLGKIERFWRTIWEEFLVRAQFANLEEAQARIRLWVKYYNHKRPHQSLDGLCPADRYFALQQQVRKAMEEGMQENLQEIALRGEAKAPFYMVGRMGEQSVVMKVEKGQFKMLVDGERGDPLRELTYDLAGGAKHEHADSTTNALQVQRTGEVQGRSGGVDGAAAGKPTEPRVEAAGGSAGGVAAPSPGGDAQGAGTEAADGQPDGTDAGGEDREALDSRAGEQAGHTAGGSAGAADQPSGPGEGRLNDDSCARGQEGRGPQSETTGSDPAGGCGPAHGHASRPATGCLPQDVLRVGEPGAEESGPVAQRPADRTTRATGGPGEGGAATPGERAGGAPEADGAQPAHPRHPEQAG